MKTNQINYREGQWFAIPINGGGFGLGIVVRGSSTTRGGLGYFFGPRYQDMPEEVETLHKNPEDAVLITWFGDLELIVGDWPLVKSARVFRKEDWPVPLFRRIDSVNPNSAWLVKYEQENPGYSKPKRIVPSPSIDLAHLPEETQYGYKALENRLSKLLK